MSKPEDDTFCEALGREAAPPVIDFGGQSYPVRLVDQDVKAVWERWLRRTAYREALETTGDADQAARASTQMAMLKQFKWGSAFSRQMLASEDGGYAFAAYLMDTDAQTVEKMAKDKDAGPRLKEALEQVVTDSFPPTASANGKAGGNPTSPAPSSTGTPASS